MKRERLGEDRGGEREEEGVSPPPSKRMNREGSESPPAIVANVAATNIKITSRGRRKLIILCYNVVNMHSLKILLYKNQIRFNKFFVLLLLFNIISHHSFFTILTPTLFSRKDLIEDFIFLHQCNQ